MTEPLGQSARSVSTEKARIQKLYKRLAKRADAVDLYERQVERAKVERNKVVCELVALGEPERAVGWAAGISGPAVHQIKERDTDKVRSQDAQRRRHDERVAEARQLSEDIHSAKANSGRGRR